MIINLDTAREVQVRQAIAANENGEVAVTSQRGGPDRGIAYIGYAGEIYVRWESGVTTPAMLPQMPRDVWTCPDWAAGSSVHNWRNYVSAEVRDLWQSFSPEQKLALYLQSEELAENEEWE